MLLIPQSRKFKLGFLLKHDQGGLQVKGFLVQVKTIYPSKFTYILESNFFEYWIILKEFS